MYRAAAVTIALLLAAAPAVAQQKTLMVAGYGGSWEQEMRKSVIPAFEKHYGV